jgi:hypothetical protein
MVSHSIKKSLDHLINFESNSSGIVVQVLFVFIHVSHDGVEIISENFLVHFADHAFVFFLVYNQIFTSVTG